jgi:segregation and condensation protein B
MLFSETKKAALECVLFVSVDSLSLPDLAEAVELDEQDVIKLLEEMIREYEKTSHGIHIIRVADGYRFVTKDEYSDEVEKILKPHISKLSRAALETLSIIAYRQPIIRVEVERIRGVNVDRILTRLMEKNLVYEVGRKETPGRPILYGTTSEFLEYFGLENLDKLPELRSVSEEEIADDLKILQQKQEESFTENQD